MSDVVDLPRDLLRFDMTDGFEFTKLIHAACERVPADGCVRFGVEAIGRVLERYAG